MTGFRTRFAAIALTVLVATVGAAPAAIAAGAKTKTAPPNCRLFNPLFEWKGGQERSLRAADNRCDAAPGRRAWLIFQGNGNLAFYLDGEQLWDSGTRGEGRLLLERSYGGLDIVNSEGGTSNAFTHWSEDEGLCGAEGGCGAVLWVSGKGVT